MSFKAYYASDIHGSELLWRKFLNAGKFYGADVLIMGGDIAGKAVIPIVRRRVIRARCRCTRGSTPTSSCRP